MKKTKIVKLCTMLTICIMLLTLDLVTKYFFYDKLPEDKVITVIPYIIIFQKLPYLNEGAAWGILFGNRIFLILISVVFLVVFILYYIKEKRSPWLFNVAFAFLVAGCVGNMVDRIFLGGVRDFIRFDFWKSFPTFNFADAILCVGVLLFLIYFIIDLVKSKKDKKNEQ